VPRLLVCTLVLVVGSVDCGVRPVTTPAGEGRSAAVQGGSSASDIVESDTAPAFDAASVDVTQAIGRTGAVGVDADADGTPGDTDYLVVWRRRESKTIGRPRTAA
jgi:hypothetical protein